eukprot:scaffold75570_cov63-Phaeocystis_antarctica.AAC.1
MVWPASAAQTADWPRLAEAWGSLTRDLISGAGRSLRRSRTLVVRGLGRAFLCLSICLSVSPAGLRLRASLLSTQAAHRLYAVQVLEAGAEEHAPPRAGLEHLVRVGVRVRVKVRLRVRVRARARARAGARARVRVRVRVRGWSTSSPSASMGCYYYYYYYYHYHYYYYLVALGINEAKVAALEPLALAVEGKSQGLIEVAHRGVIVRGNVGAVHMRHRVLVPVVRAGVRVRVGVGVASQP